MSTKRRERGTGTYINRDSRHIIQYWEDSKRKTRSYPSELLARSALNLINSGQKLPNVPKVQQKVRVLFKNWIESQPKSTYFRGCDVRFKQHWDNVIGDLTPNEIDIPKLKEAIASFKEKGLSRGYIGLLFRILSSFLSELLEDEVISKNPIISLSRKTKKQFISEKDPTKTPFLKNPAHVAELFTWLNGMDEAISIAFALGVMGGLRLNEIRALHWEDVNFNKRLIYVKWQAGTYNDGELKLRKPKDHQSRVIPMSDSLHDLLQVWFEKVSHSHPLVVRPPITGEDRKIFIGQKRLNKLIRKGLRVLKMPKMTFYGATRHTFASQYIMNGGSMVKLKEILGHSSITTTERFYVHIVPGQYSEKDRNVINIDLKQSDKSTDWKLKEINSPLREQILPSDGNFNIRDSRRNNL